MLMDIAIKSVWNQETQCYHYTLSGSAYGHGKFNMCYRTFEGVLDDLRCLYGEAARTWQMDHPGVSR